MCGLRAEITIISLIFVELLEYEERKREIELVESVHREDYCAVRKIQAGSDTIKYLEEFFRRI